jgi:hypothetical protein
MFSSRLIFDLNNAPAELPSNTAACWLVSHSGSDSPMRYPVFASQAASQKIQGHYHNLIPQCFTATRNRVVSVFREKVGYYSYLGHNPDGSILSTGKIINSL